MKFIEGDLFGIHKLIYWMVFTWKVY